MDPGGDIPASAVGCGRPGASCLCRMVFRTPQFLSHSAAGRATLWLPASFAGKNGVRSGTSADPARACAGSCGVPGGDRAIRDKTVVITGTTSGIGRATALALSRQGARLLLVARNPQRAAETEREIKAGGTDAVRTFIADLSSLSEVRRV